MTDPPDRWNGISLARWQGGVDAAIRTHEERLNSVAADMRAIKETMAGLHDDVRQIKRTLDDSTAEAKFRWTKLSVMIAATALLVTLALNLYFSAQP